MRRSKIRDGASVVRATRWARAQKVRCYRQWSDETEAEFLDALAANGSVTVACEEADVGHTSVYRRRRNNAAFALKWQAALEQGYARLELELVRAAIDSLARVEFDASRPMAPMSGETALKVLALHRQSVTGSGKRSGHQPEPPRKLIEVQDELIARADVIRRARDANKPTL